MDHFEIDKAAVCGHSMGGTIVAEMALNRPERLTAIILEDPAFNRESLPAPAYIGMSTQGKQWYEWLLGLRQLSRADALASIADDVEGWAPIDAEMYLEDRLTCDLAIFDQLDFSIRGEWRQALQANEAPLLLVTGDPAKGGIINDEFADLIFAENGGGERLHVESAGHGIHREQYQPFYNGVSSFLRSHLG